ncbi:MAG: efflux RND transporter periplasmic adaptor subunit [Candidatus Thiodiazotropha sp.]
MRTVYRTVFLMGMLLSPVLSAEAWDGVVDWAQRTALSTATSGVVNKVLVRAGDRVAKGDLLVQLEQRALRARVAQGKAEMKHKQLLRDEANKELERAEELYARTLLADHDLNLAKIEYASADAVYQRSRADYLLAQQQLAYSELHAPFDAVVLARLVQPSETVVTQLRAEPMLVIAAAGKRLARFTVSPGSDHSLSVGQKVVIEVSGKRYEGTVTSVERDSNGKTSGYRLEAEFDTDSDYAPGMALKVSR